MNTQLVMTRKFNKEEYKIFLNTPSYPGEKGILGIELDPYVEVETPENCFGYHDYVHFSHEDCSHGHTMWRYLQPWIIKKLEAVASKILDDYWSRLYAEKGLVYREAGRG